MPVGVFGVAAGTIATTGLARRAAAGDMEGLRDTLGRSVSLLAFLTIPATVGLVVLGEPIVRLLFERGRFHAVDTEATAHALALYAIGLVGYTGVKVLAPAFYALGAPGVALRASALAVAANLVVILALHPSMGYRAIALGNALGSLLNVIVLAAAFQARTGGLVTARLPARTDSPAPRRACPPHVSCRRCRRTHERQSAAAVPLKRGHRSWRRRRPPRAESSVVRTGSSARPD